VAHNTVNAAPGESKLELDHLVLGHLDLMAANPFGPTSIIRWVAAEPIAYALYPRALVMEVAHPSVGAGVADHSGFQRQPLRRLWATVDAAIRLVFGRGDEPMGAARQIYHLHDRIHGAGSAGWYTAHDATLLLWVWATLVDICDVAFTRWVRPYRPGEAEAFYQDMAAFARFFGIPQALIPKDRPAFARYLDQMLEADLLGTTATSARLVRDILWFQRWYTPSSVTSAFRVVTIGTLDERLAERLDLRLTPDEQRQFWRLDATLRRHYSQLPEWRRRLPDAYLAARRQVVAAKRATTSSSLTGPKSS
jgi:uncharacterized protein (DUF2236 family)